MLRIAFIGYSEKELDQTKCPPSSASLRVQYTCNVFIINAKVFFSLCVKYETRFYEQKCRRPSIYGKVKFKQIALWTLNVPSRQTHKCLEQVSPFLVIFFLHAITTRCILHHKEPDAWIYNFYCNLWFTCTQSWESIFERRPHVLHGMSHTSGRASIIANHEIHFILHTFN